MYKIVKKQELTTNIYLMEVEAKRVAKTCEPGQFVIVRMDSEGERIPLTICDYNREKGTITIVFQTVGAGTKMMAQLEEGEYFHDFVGPLGRPSELVEQPLEEVKSKKILFVAGGVGAAPVYPQVKWLHEHGIAADVIVGSKTKDLLILEKEMESVAGNLYVTTDDGSYGRSGMVTQTIKDLVAEGKKYDLNDTIVHWGKSGSLDIKYYIILMQSLPLVIGHDLLQIIHQVCLYSIDNFEKVLLVRILVSGFFSLALFGFPQIVPDMIGIGKTLYHTVICDGDGTMSPFIGTFYDIFCL